MPDVILTNESIAALGQLGRLTYDLVLKYAVARAQSQNRKTVTIDDIRAVVGDVMAEIAKQEGKNATHRADPVSAY